MREYLGGKPVVITSGYRCAVHNRAVGDAKQSQHLLGNAVDIMVSDVALHKVAVVSKKIGFPGFRKAYRFYSC